MRALRDRAHGACRTLSRAAIGLVVVALATLTLLVASAPDPRALLGRSPSPSLVLLDRHGAVLRMVPAPGGERYLEVDLGQVSPYLVPAVLAAEDRRFFHHPGVDPLALARAVGQDLRTGRIVSGGSTVSMQLARLLAGYPRTVVGKVRQVALALRLELSLDKREILTAYLSRVPMGNGVVGYAAAAEAYLDKPLAQLSPAECALLAAVPRAPSVANPRRRLEHLLRRRDQVLRRMAAHGWLPEVATAAALAEQPLVKDTALAYPAPHFVARVLDELGEERARSRTVVTTLEPELQRRLEVIVGRRLGELVALGGQHMAVAVLDVGAGEWLAIEGSGGFWDRPGGQIDGTRAPRQPGSALKPFTYATAFDASLSAAALLDDLPHAFTWSTGTWSPRNYDGRYHGPMTARRALACSVNVPAAHVLDGIGPSELLRTLQRAGISTLGDDASRYGLGLTLGAGEVRLDELVAAYAALLRGGVWRPATAWRRALDGAGATVAVPDLAVTRQVCSAEAAAQVVDILADPEARAPAFGPWSVLRLPFAAAVKTGTSEGFRDNWCIGGTAEVVVGVWCGGFDRAPMGNVSGVSGAGTVWREVMLAWADVVHRDEDLSTRATLSPLPAELRRVVICDLSGLRAGPDCPRGVGELLRPGQEPGQSCDWHHRDETGRVVVRWPARYLDWATREGLSVAAAPPRPADRLAVLTPADGDAFVIVPDLPRRYQTLELRCVAPGQPAEVTWVVDGQPLVRVGSPFAAAWALEPGRHRIHVEVGTARSAPVTVEVHGG